METPCDLTTEWRYRSSGPQGFWMLAVMSIVLGLLGLLSFWVTPGPKYCVAFLPLAPWWVWRALSHKNPTAAEMRTDRVIWQPASSRETVVLFRDVNSVRTAWGRVILTLQDGRNTSVAKGWFAASEEVKHFRRELTARVAAAKTSREEAKEAVDAINTEQLAMTSEQFPSPPRVSAMEWRYLSSRRRVYLVVGVAMTIGNCLFLTRPSPHELHFMGIAFGLVNLAKFFVTDRSPEAELRSDRLVIRPGSARQAEFAYADILDVRPARSSSTLTLQDGRVRELDHWNFLNAEEVRHFQHELTARVAAAKMSREGAKPAKGSETSHQQSTVPS